jgi:hypothetical protein
LLAHYTLATGNFGIRALSVSDVFTLTLFTYQTANPSGTRLLTATAPLIFASGTPRPPDAGTIQEASAKASYFMSLDVHYQAAYRRYAQAMRALHAGDLPLAAIQAMVSLEGALHHYVKACISGKTDSFGNIRLNIANYIKAKKDISLSFVMSALFPLLVPDDVQFPKEAVDACNKLRQKRNNAIHEPADFDGRGIERELQAVDVLLRFLIGNHPRTVDTGGDRPVPNSSVGQTASEKADVAH